MRYGFFRTACASPELKVADCSFNAEKIITDINKAAAKEAELVVFPELTITGYTCSDLFFQETLLTSAVCELERIAKETSSLNIISIVGLPFNTGNGIYNTAAVLFKGEVIALVPKTFIPNYSEFYERRQFTPYTDNKVTEVFLSKKFQNVPFGTNIIIKDTNNPLLALAVEICEDGWVSNPPSTSHCLNGANVIANLSASNEIIGKASYRRLLIESNSAKNICAYLYADASSDESSTDMVFASHNIIAENGYILSEAELFQKEMIFADIDLGRISADRNRTSTFSDCSKLNSKDYTTIYITLKELNLDKSPFFFRTVTPDVFVPQDESKRMERSREVVELQAQGLAKRLRHIGATKAVIGLSGGLDSTLAFLVTCHAFELCGLSKKGIIAITMPGFGTTDRTYSNACELAEGFDAQLKEISIAKSVTQHFEDIGQDINIHDITYENGQARERTQILMDIANKENAIVIGTGDLSELALGWCTYNGDHMSMYGVNASIPKTLVRYLVEWFAIDAKNKGEDKTSNVLRDILDTPVSPELLPPEEGKISQKTEDIVGPYRLHDFFLYYLLRFGFAPSKIFFLASKAFDVKEYPTPVIKNWMKTFYRRFFTQQFKRSCMPDGAKVGTISLSPRGDWRMPSDASSSIWLKEIEEL